MSQILRWYLVLLLGAIESLRSHGNDEQTQQKLPRPHYCHGHWETPSYEKSDYRIQASRAIYNHSDPQASRNQFLQEACPAQRTLYTCYFTNDDIERSSMLERRYFHIDSLTSISTSSSDHVYSSRSSGSSHMTTSTISDESNTCHQFYPAAFLSLLKNRKVLLLGDSVMGQTWESIVCSLYTYEESKLYTEFWIIPNCPDRECPYKPIKKKDIYKNNPLHGNIKQGYLALKQTNSTLTFLFYSMLQTNRLQSLLQEYRLTKDDIIIYNHGLFYNEVSEYQIMLKNLSLEISQLLQNSDERMDRVNRQSAKLEESRRTTGNVPYIFFLHSTPQHFPSTNGYYVDPVTHQKPVKGRQCVAINGLNESSSMTDDRFAPSTSLLYENDWRNRLVHEIFRDLERKNQIFIVPTAVGLQSQFDAHVNKGDCTHWCFPSSIFKYIHLMLYNALLRRLSPSPTGAQVDDKDMTWALHPTLQNFELVRYSHRTDIGLIVKGRLNRFHNLAALEHHGYSLDDVRVIHLHTVGEISLGPTIYDDTTLHGDPLPTLTPTKMPLTQPKFKPAGKVASTSDSSSLKNGEPGRHVHHGQGIRHHKPKPG